MVRVQKLESGSLDRILEMKETCERVEKLHGVVNHKIKMKSDFNWLRDELSLEGKITGGNFFETPNPFHIHTDTGKREELGELNPKWNIVVPLVEDPTFKTVIFDQQWSGNAAHFWVGSLFKYFPEPVYNEKRTDYEGVENLTGKDFDVDDYVKYLRHLPYETVNGLSIKSVVPWKLGEVLVFDSTLLHSSSYFTKYKKGLTLLVSN